MENANTNKSEITVVTIENFPSRVELFKYIDEFLREQNLPLTYKVHSKDNSLKFCFSNSETALEVIKRLNIEKTTNSLYEKLIILLSFDDKKNYEKARLVSLPTIKRHKAMKTMDDGVQENTYIHRKMKDLSSKAGIMRTSSPYIEPDKAFRLREKENEKKNISKNRFNSCFSKATTNRSVSDFIPNYVNLTPSLPVNQFKFRISDKKKWIGKGDFKLY